MNPKNIYSSLGKLGNFKNLIIKLFFEILKKKIIYQNNFF